MSKKYGIKIKKRKTAKSWLNRTMNRIVLPLYLAFLTALFIVMMVMLEINVSDTVAKITTFVYIGLVVAVSFGIVFIVIPKCRAAQALKDLKDYDFTPHSAKDEEYFVYEKEDALYYFTPSPFIEDDGVTTLTGEEQLDGYLRQFAPNSLKLVEPLGESGSFIPFYTFDFGQIHSTFIAEKSIQSDFIRVKMTNKYELTFAEDGVHFYGEVIPYDEIEAMASANFVRQEARASVCVNLLLSDVALASFAFGTRIMSVINKHKIKMLNKDLADFILNDPEKAFRLIGLKNGLGKRRKTKREKQ